MTPQEYEWACEQIELAYERKQIGKIAFCRRMKKLGFSIEFCREMIDDIDSSTGEKK